MDEEEQMAGSSAECYDPDTNTWSQIENMNIGRHSHILVGLNERLYAIGGLDGSSILGYSYIDNVEVYNPVDNTWTLLQQKLDGEMSNSGYCLLKKYYIV